jgi:N-acetyl-gamma-glutamyl-phosphate reductase
MKVRVGIVGASGYSGEELLHLLLRHPGIELAFVTSRQHAGKTLGKVFPRFASHPLAKELCFIEPEPQTILEKLGRKIKHSVVFLALPHGVAAEIAVPLLKEKVRVIDLSADFRLRSSDTYKEFYGHSHPAPELLKDAIYGLPEIKRSAIRKARLLASPGCYPTSILLPLIPLLKSKLIKSEDIVVNSLSGVSGAGRKAEEMFLFCECNESIRAYSTPKHRHLSEIEQELSEAAGKKVVIQFTPHLIPINRGICTTICVKPRSSGAEITKNMIDCYEDVYGGEPFVRLLHNTSLPDTKHVVGTNFIEIAHRYDPRTKNVLLFSAEDNLTKGASGQAVQSMNIMFGFPETDGLI